MIKKIFNSGLINLNIDSSFIGKEIDLNYKKLSDNSLEEILFKQEKL